MRFQLDHDWQGNMSTPRAKVGESAKTQLLLLLCVFWIFLGLVGHAPWKPTESKGISVVSHILDGGSLIAPLATAESTVETPPLYYIVAATGAKVFKPFLSMHDGARLMNALWMSIVLLMVGMTGRELWVRGVGRHATFIMIGTIGLVTSAHSLTPEVAGLAAYATGFYSLSLSKRRPWRASALLGVAFTIGFLSNGILPLVILLSTILLLCTCFKSWRTASFAKVTSTALFLAIPFISAWLILMYIQQPAMLSTWWVNSLPNFSELNHNYFARILIWYAWPALPLALWGLWRYRAQLITKPKFQLILVFFFCALVCLGLWAETRDTSALPLLLPLVALGAGSVEHLKRGAAAALNWFGISLFGIIGFLIWLGWFAMMTGSPAKIKVRMQFLSAMQNLTFSWLAFILALTLTAVWLFTCLRVRQTNKSTVTNWAVGMTFGWGLLMTLWLPMIDSAKSYEQVFTSLNKALPKNHDCLNSLQVGTSQALLLNYYTDIELQPLETTKTLSCNLYLIQDERGAAKMQPGDEWKMIWSGKRAADRHESFRLFERVN